MCVCVFTDNDDKKDLSSVYFFHYRMQMTFHALLSCMILLF